ncbi:O-antigen ligase family protein, partial [Alphaproteobacteria bacterium]|nr:O-antigen ligase family protein [Alphaproteobacteria bacterium]
NNFALYQREIIEEKKKLLKKYPVKTIQEECKKNNRENQKTNLDEKKCNDKILNVFTFQGLMQSKNKHSLAYDFILYHKLFIDYKLLHRKVIWSFSKKKILEKPIFGNGFFTSRTIGNEFQLINQYNYKMAAIPLHPHNTTLQLWLELGLIGIILYYSFFIYLFAKINSYSKINFNYAAVSFVSLLQIFLITQLSFGLWQSWWIAIIFFCIFLYSLLFVNLSNEK